MYGDRQRVIDQLYPSASIAPAATRHLLQLNEKIVDQLSRLKLQTQRRQLDIRQGAKATRAYQDLAAAKPKG